MARRCPMLAHQSLVAAALILGLLMVPSAGRSDSPRLGFAEVARPPSIEEAFAQIRIGMVDMELFRLMAPYKRRFTGHYQWQVWTDGRADVVVTIWPNDAPGKIFGAGRFRVREKDLFKRGLGKLR
jgi:hypothetical protein